MELGTLVQESWHAYQTFSVQHPLLSSIVTAEATFPIGDAAAQLMTDRRVNPHKLAFTAALAPLYGAAMYGLMQTVELPKQLGFGSLGQAALGPNLWGNLVNLGIYINNAVGEKTTYSLAALGSFYQKLFYRDEQAPKNIAQALRNAGKNINENTDWKEYGKSVALVLTAWNAIQWYNIEHVQPEMRTQFALSLTIPWVIGLTYSTILAGRKLASQAHTSGPQRSRSSTEGETSA